MPVSQTSIDAYIDITLEGISSKQQRAIYTLLKSEGKEMTRREISERIGMATGTVGGRCSDMVDELLIEDGEKRECTISGKVVKTVFVE